MMGYSQVHEEEFPQDLRVHKKHSAEEMVTRDLQVPTPPQEEPCFSPDGPNETSYHRQPEKPNAKNTFKAYPNYTFKLNATTGEASPKMMESSKNAWQRKEPMSLPNEQSLSGETEEKDFGVPTPPQEELCFSPESSNAGSYQRQPAKPNANSTLKAYPNDAIELNVTTDETPLKYREEMRVRSKRRRSTSLPNVQSTKVSGETEGKDAAYWEMRKKNNEAAKRSREARKTKIDELVIKTAYLEQENSELRGYIEAKQYEYRTVMQSLSTTPVQQVQQFNHLNYYLRNYPN